MDSYLNPKTSLKKIVMNDFLRILTFVLQKYFHRPL